jgi:hypothetical protein
MIAPYNNSSDQLRRPNSEYRDKYTTLPITSVLWELSHSVYAKPDCVPQNFTWLTYRRTFEISTLRDCWLPGCWVVWLGNFPNVWKKCTAPVTAVHFFARSGRNYPTLKRNNLADLFPRYKTGIQPWIIVTHKILHCCIISSGYCKPSG